ncbi:class C beta-lactamase-related serine hydrolase [Seongchinamella sediminis]|uniref:Class C beta-lactamase-related serine hydrolase n=2 Tax=Seongchinamella sediminis TaxID=2283635 RepID=A0A3L7DS12_9GAMM|nr:class C beta-lactamase-related serine hydrolase [Seongchinamella sediminis]
MIASSLAALCLPLLANNVTVDYYEANRQMIRNGVQAVLLCNGLYTSRRTLAQVFAQELAYLDDPRFGGSVGSPEGGNFRIDHPHQLVNVGGDSDGVAISAAFRQGIGCVVMAPGMGEEAIDQLPSLSLPTPDMSNVPWPDGDLVAEGKLPEEVSATALQAASDWAFNRDNPEQDTISLLIVHRGHIVHERYAPGFDLHTRTRTWSTAKSIAATLIGMQVDAGKLALDGPLPIDWLPDMQGAGADPRSAITLRHVLHMSSGLYPVDSFGMEYATGSGLAYWAGASSAQGMRDRGLVRQPGSHWEYENYDTLLAVYALKQSLEDDGAYLRYPGEVLFQRIGMHNTLASTDRFGDFIFSSQVYTNARDLARFGLLYLNGGRWQGERLLSPEWITFSRTPAPAAAQRGNDYGGQWWLVPDARKGEVPADAFTTAGNRGQYVIVAPSHDLVIVRRGLDYGRQGFDPWELLQEVVKAFPKVQ